MRKLFSLFLFFSILFRLESQQLGLPFTKFYSSKEYNGGIQNYAISQNQYGLIYAANNFGLLEYDGTSWERYSLPNSTKIRHIHIENNGRIYVAGQGQLGYFRPNETGKLEFISWLRQLPLEHQNVEEVWKVFKINENYIFCTIKRLFIFDSSGNMVDIIESDSEYLSFNLSNNQLYLQGAEEGLLRLDKNKTVVLNNSSKIKNTLISGILESGSGELQIFTEAGDVFSFSPTQLTDWKADLLPKLSKVNTAVRLRNGNIAIGTQYNGIYIIDEDGKLELHMDLEKGLQNNTVISIFEDKGGNLWLGHNNGITILELSLPFRVLGTQSGIQGTGYTARYHDGNVYLGTNIEVSKIPANETIAKRINNSEGQAYSLGVLANSLLLAHNEGAFSIENNSARNIPGPNGIWGFLQLKDHPNFLLAGTYSGLALYEKKNNDLSFIRRLNGFEESSRLIQEDDEGNIWMSHGYKGIYKLNLSDDWTSVSSKFYGIKEGLPTNLLNSVWKIGGRLVFTTEYGLYTFNQATDRFEKDKILSPYFERDFLITSLIEDPVGNIFYIGNEEVGVLEKQADGTFEKNFQIFNKIVPLLNDDLQNVSLLKSNEVLFAANEGFIWYKLDKNKVMPPVYPAFIKSVYLTKSSDSLFAIGNHIDLMNSKFGLESKGEGLKLPYHLADIRFEFTNTIPNNENSTLFRFYLEGLEKEFGDWTNKRDKAFTNLREGSYVFHVQSKDLYGQVTQANPFTFTVLPPWYRTNLAWFIYLLAGIVVLVIVFRKVDKLYQKKTKAITAKQQKELDQKSQDLETSQKELEKLKTEKLEAEINIKNKELASATMHLLNKNGFIDHTKTHLSQIIKKSKNQEVKNELQKVINSIDKNISNDNDWEQFAIHFDQVHGDFMGRFKKVYPNLSPQEFKLTAYLRMNLSTKEIAYLMNISTRGVEISRYRLRKKLGLERSENLQEFILKF